MAVTRDIVAAHLHPRRVMARLLAAGVREDRALAMLMGGCFILFAAQWPWRARQAHLQGLDLTDLIQTDMFALIFFMPLLVYALAAIVHLLARLVGGRGSWYSSRLALFWALLASSPLLVLAGLVKGFIGLGPANTLTGGVWLVVFLWIWGNSMVEAERG